jgi:hypothetical protein
MGDGGDIEFSNFDLETEWDFEARSFEFDIENEVCCTVLRRGGAGAVWEDSVIDGDSLESESIEGAVALSQSDPRNSR